MRSARLAKATSKGGKKAPKGTARAAVAKVAKQKSVAPVDVYKFIDEEARDTGGENEYDTDAAEQLRKAAESSLAEYSDEEGTSLVAHLPLPDDHTSNPWVWTSVWHKGEQALKVLDACAKSLAKPKDARLKTKLREAIADAMAYQEPELTAAQVALKEAHGAALAKSPEYKLECARAGGATPAKLNSFRWKELGTKPIPFLVAPSKASPANS
jgi:hypothetical protein